MARVLAAAWRGCWLKRRWTHARHAQRSGSARAIWPGTRVGPSAGPRGIGRQCQQGHVASCQAFIVRRGSRLGRRPRLGRSQGRR